MKSWRMNLTMTLMKRNKPRAKSNKTIPAHTYSSIHAYLIVCLGVWSFYATGSKTYFLPVLMAVPILTMNNGLRFNEIVPSIIALLFTILSIFGVAYSAYEFWVKGDIEEIAKSSVMILAGTISAITIIISVYQRGKVKKTIRNSK